MNKGQYTSSVDYFDNSPGPSEAHWEPKYYGGSLPPPPPLHHEQPQAQHQYSGLPPMSSFDQYAPHSPQLTPISAQSSPLPLSSQVSGGASMPNKLYVDYGAPAVSPPPTWSQAPQQRMHVQYGSTNNAVPAGELHMMFESGEV